MPVAPPFADQVVVVSNHPIFAKTLVRLAREAGCDVLASVTDLGQALPKIKPNSNVTAIVDNENLPPRDDEWVNLFRQSNAIQRVILVSLARNEMIIHELRRVYKVNEQDLKKALGPVKRSSQARSIKSKLSKQPKKLKGE
jgi:hypothetical protein